MNSFLTKTLTVGKLNQVGVTSKSSYVMGSTEYDCSDAQQVTPEETQMYEGQIGHLEKRFVEYACTADIGDKVIISGVNYKVKGMSKSDYGSVKYIRLILVKSDANSNSDS